MLVGTAITGTLTMPPRHSAALFHAGDSNDDSSARQRIAGAQEAVDAGHTCVNVVSTSLPITRAVHCRFFRDWISDVPAHRYESLRHRT